MRKQPAKPTLKHPLHLHRRSLAPLDLDKLTRSLYSDDVIRQHCLRQIAKPAHHEVAITFPLTGLRRSDTRLRDDESDEMMAHADGDLDRWGPSTISSQARLGRGQRRNTTSNQTQREARSSSGPQMSLFRPVQPPEEDLARSFFFFHFFSLGRELGASRHAFDLLPTTLLSERHDSALSLAFSVASTRMWLVWRSRSRKDRQRIVAPYMLRAVQRLQKAIDDPVESRSAGTVLAAFVLQFDEICSALTDHHKPAWVHHEGAMAITQHQLTDTQNPINATLLHNVFQVEISYALRYKRIVDPFLFKRVTRSGIIKDDAIGRLDMIGVDVARCQHLVEALQAKHSHISCYAGLQIEANAILGRLLSWPNTVPEDWRPVHVDRVRKTVPPIITYSGGCDIYPSVQLADLWNTWRCRQLIILDIILRTMMLDMPHSRNAAPDASPSKDRHTASEIPVQATRYLEMVQRLMDDVCETYPYFLGNASTPADYNGLSSHEYPSYHDLDPDVTGAGPRSQKPFLMSRELHVRHALTQGPWFAAPFLIFLITLISKTDSPIGTAIRSGQLEWLFQQFRRILVLWRIDRGDWSAVDFIRERLRNTTSI